MSSAVHFAPSGADAPFEQARTIADIAPLKDLDCPVLSTYNSGAKNRVDEERMNEKRIQQVVEIEKQAKQLLESAMKEAESLPAQAEREAQEIIAKARADAQGQARRMLDRGQAAEQTAQILSEADQKVRESETKAKKNFDRAVDFVLERVIGKA